MNDSFEPRDGELWYVEVYDRNTESVVNRLGPLPIDRAIDAELNLCLFADNSRYKVGKVRA